MVTKILQKKIEHLEHRVSTLENNGSIQHKPASVRAQAQGGWEKLYGLRKHSPILKKEVAKVRRRLFGV